MSRQLRGRAVTRSVSGSPRAVERIDTESTAEAQGENTENNPTQDIELELEIERKRKEQIEELLKLRQQVHDLSAQLRSGGIDTSGVTLVSRPRIDTDEPESKGRDIMVKDMEQLPNNPSFKRQGEWLQDLDRAFKLAPNKFNQDEKRILWALENTTRENRQRWDRHVEELPKTERDDAGSNWEGFKEWTVKLVQDSSHRELDTSDRYERAQQQGNQSPADFDAYLASLERHMPQRTEEDRARTFCSKLHDWLRVEIKTHSDKVPTTRSAMVDLATRHWEASKAAKRARAPTVNRSGPPPKRHSSHARRETQPSQPRQDTPRRTQQQNPTNKEGKRLRCYNCDSEDHLRNQCPKPLKNQINQVRQGDSGSTAKGSGKAKGSLQGSGTRPPRRASRSDH